ncbi:hypothetical protein [Verrucomicrobium spinosum]|uniref:hypothetical protein n=1 Tax=Verrucomicrobium spinosum TaxID=2736 RepID=UPI000946418B|nr:hypothetical protein [Verrucomicrobium spinosum]
MAHAAERGFVKGPPAPLATTASLPDNFNVSGWSGFTPATRKYHQQGQPRSACPPGINLTS